jgi:hypothetical protein
MSARHPSVTGGARSVANAWNTTVPIVNVLTAVFLSGGR